MDKETQEFNGREWLFDKMQVDVEHNSKVGKSLIKKFGKRWDVVSRMTKFRTIKDKWIEIQPKVFIVPNNEKHEEGRWVDEKNDHDIRIVNFVNL